MVELKIKLFDVVELSSGGMLRGVLPEKTHIGKYQITLLGGRVPYKNVMVHGSFLHPLIRDLMAQPSELEQATKFEKMMRRAGL